jgi:hypothetical protein
VWTVRNLGSEATYRAWGDVVILSRDLLLDPTDPVVGSYRHTTPLGAGESRTVRFTIQVPAHLTGPFRTMCLWCRTMGTSCRRRMNGIM